MPPKSACTSNENYDLSLSCNPLLDMAAAELERIRKRPSSKNNDENGVNSGVELHPFPAACLALVRRLPGNNRCIDCGSNDPQWATVSYGALLCLQCSGQHRSLGVQVSCVRSLTMDSWSHSQIISMLEGGNKQLDDFFRRHALCVNNDNRDGHSGVRTQIGKRTGIDNVLTRYRTKAALFYREHLNLHADKVCKAGSYKGREASRSPAKPSRAQGRRSAAQRLSEEVGLQTQMREYRVKDRRSKSLQGWEEPTIAGTTTV